MNHLSHAELIDLVESAPAMDPGRRRHGATCAECRAHADDIAAAMALASEDGGGEPSPLFWNHFSARVSEAVRHEALEPRASRSWPLGGLTPWAALAAIVLIISTVVWRTTLHAPTGTTTADRAASIALDAAAPVADDVESDQAWAIVRVAARDFDLDAAGEAGIAAHPAAVDEAVRELTSDERVELARLLNLDLRRNGGA